MKSLLFFSLIFITHSSFSSLAVAANPVPDYTVQVGQEQNGKMKGWLLNFLPPEGHHFNTEAPMKVTAFDGKTAFLKVGAAEDHVGYRLSDPKLVDGTEVDSSIFLCDQAKTFCVKKTLKFALKVNSDLHSLEFAPAADPAPEKSENLKLKKKPGKKDAHNFWDNDLNGAIAEAVRLKKPLLIDFYGIWCPPCNLYSENVYPKAKFQSAAQKWVLLKMDADKTASFELKSKFKISGYPTTLALKVPQSKNTNVAGLSEIDRVVGYFPLDEFVSMINHFYTDRSTTMDDKLKSQKQAYLETLRQKLKPLLLIDLTEQDLKDALTLSQDGERLASDDHFYPLMSLLIKSQTDASVLKTPASTELLNKVWSDRTNESPDSLMRFEEITTTHPEQFTKEQIGRTNDVLDQLANRVSLESLSVPGVELSIADIDAMRTDVAEALGDSSLLKKSYERTAESYKKLITQFKGENSRGYNLELAYALWKSGKVDEAKAIYAKFIAEYPSEFTFYFAACKMYLETNDLDKAREMGERAFQYSYGDNKIRSLERLMRVLIAKGNRDEALKRGSDFLATAEKPSAELHVRTRRYLSAIEKMVSDSDTKVNKP